MDHELQAAIHLCLLNRGIRITPFHSMLLYCPVTQEGEVDRLAQVLGDCLAELTRRQSRRGPWPASRGPFRQ
jgi:glutamate-1-semialdehyde 2,1-aminomutase